MTASHRNGRPRPEAHGQDAITVARRVVGRLPVAGFAVLAVGCGGAEATLSGRVLMDGEPIVIEQDMTGKVVFQATSGNAAPAFGTIDATGNYEAMTGAHRGLSPGEYVVTVDVTQTIPSPNPDLPPWAKRVTPQRYVSSRSSGLSVTVDRGSNEYDIQITSEAG